MTTTSHDYDDSTIEYQECYRYEIFQLTPNDYLTRTTQYRNAFSKPEFDMLMSMYIYKGTPIYLLVGYRLELCSDPYDKLVLIAMSDSKSELYVLADLVGLEQVAERKVNMPA